MVDVRTGPIAAFAADWLHGWRDRLPGLVVVAAGVALSLGVHRLASGVSPLITAIVSGVVLANVVRLPAAFDPGITFAAKKLLRVGIAFLGLKLVIGDILGLGGAMIGVIAVIVAGGIFGTLVLGRWLRIRPAQTLLIACGFSICGAAAVAGVEGVTDSEEEDVVTAVALVVIFGTLMIPVIPLLGGALRLSEQVNGLWAGGAIHEIAQVVAAGGLIGPSALAVAVVVKLGRVLMLAPVVTVLSIRQRRIGPQSGTRPPIVPGFVIGFIAMVALRSAGVLPEGALAVGDLLQNIFLSAAMFGLGCGVRITKLKQVGLRPFLLALGATIWVAVIAFTGIQLTQ